MNLPVAKPIGKKSPYGWEREDTTECSEGKGGTDETPSFSISHPARLPTPHSSMTECGALPYDSTIIIRRASLQRLQTGSHISLVPWCPVSNFHVSCLVVARKGTFLTCFKQRRSQSAQCGVMPPTKSCRVDVL